MVRIINTILYSLNEIYFRLSMHWVAQCNQAVAVAEKVTPISNASVLDVGYKYSVAPFDIFWDTLMHLYNVYLYD